MPVRSSLSWATERPRYSVSRTAVELRNRSVSSATEASLFAMWLLNNRCALQFAQCRNAIASAAGRNSCPLKKLRRKRTELESTMNIEKSELHTPARATLLQRPSIGVPKPCGQAHQQPAVFGSSQDT